MVILILKIINHLTLHNLMISYMIGSILRGNFNKHGAHFIHTNSGSSKISPKKKNFFK